MPVFTNQTALKSVRKALHSYRNGISRLLVASAFFTDAEEILEIAKMGVQVNLIVRLGEGTSNEALRKILPKEKVHIRYYTSSKFHPKLYIFGNQMAMLGSANFTKSGLNSNSEVCITVDGSGPDFFELASLFSEYWNNAAVLNADALAAYDRALAKRPAQEFNLEKEIENNLGAVIPISQIDVTKRTKSKENLFIEDYDRHYQVFKSAYDEVEVIYKKYGKRKVSEDQLPLRIEIDQFLNYVRSLFIGDEHLEAPIRPSAEFEVYIQSILEDWFNKDWTYLDKIVDGYTRISKSFGSVDEINQMSKDQIFENLLICHAFHDSFRFYYGGLETLKASFLNDNEEGKVRETLNYLLHGNGKFTTRMANCIYGSYKLQHMGDSSVQELLGWVNHENVPICNGRTKKSLRYLGKEVS